MPILYAFAWAAVFYRQAAKYSRLAAEQAEAATPWDEAARHYQDCLGLMADAEDSLGEEEAALLSA